MRGRGTSRACGGWRTGRAASIVGLSEDRGSSAVAQGGVALGTVIRCSCFLMLPHASSCLLVLAHACSCSGCAKRAIELAQNGGQPAGQLDYSLRGGALIGRERLEREELGLGQ